MATTVYDIVEVELSNGETITLKPLPIKKLRKFMEIIKEMDAPGNESEDAAMDIFIKAAMLCLENIKPDLSSDQENFSLFSSQCPAINVCAKACNFDSKLLRY